MDDYELREILNSYKDAISALVERVDALGQGVDFATKNCEELRTMVFEQIVKPVEEEMNTQIYNAKLNDFKSRYGDKLGGFEDSLRAVEGDDFDIYKQAYDGYTAYGEDAPFSEDEYVEKLAAQVEQQLSALKDKLGVNSVTATVDEEGDVAIVAGGEELGEEKAALDDEIEMRDVDEASDEEELAKYEQELLENYK